MSLNKFKLTIFCLFLVFTCLSASKLNVPRVLLPIFSDFSTKFTLEAIDGGCYKWITTRSDIISLEPVTPDQETGCSSKLIVNTLTKDESRNLAVVVGEEIHTSQILKCDVIVDVISSLTVVTQTRELFMEEVPVTFQVIAKDAQGNEFSTLEGVEFEWTIVSIVPNAQTPVLRYITFRDSLYETPPHIEALEEQDKQGYMILLEGIKTGSAKVSVKLPFHEYKHVEATEILLTVVANLLVTPAEVYIMPGDVVYYKVFYMHSGRMDEIILPDEQYYLSSENKDIAIVNDDSNEVSAVGVGKTKVLLHNRGVNESDPNVKLPSANVNVMVPAYMSITILPYKNWAILVGDHHDILAEVFSITDHKLYLGPGIEIKTQISDAFHVESKVMNGSWFSGWGVKEATAPVECCLEVVKHPRLGDFPLRHPIKATADLFIYPRISIIPSEVILPWDPVVRPKYTVPLVAKGGDGRFLWTSSDHSVGSVTQNGIVRTHAQGSFEVMVAMLRNHHNYKVARFSILPPARLEIVDYVMEAEIGRPLYLHIALYPENSNTPFTQCQNLPFQVRQSDNKFRQNKSGTIPPVGRACGNIAMVGVVVGSTKVTVSYYQEGKTLEDSVVITAFFPLKLVEPHDGDIVMAVGSSMNLVYIGGPRPVLGRLHDHQILVQVNDTSIATVEDISKSVEMPNEDNTAVYVLCKKLGETTFKLIITNLPILPNCRSKASVLETQVICGKVRRLQLQPEIKVSHAEACPMDLSADRVVVKSDQDIELDVIVLDDANRRFLNITSLLFQWDLKPSQSGVFGSLSSVFPRNITYGKVEIAFKNYQTIRALKDTGVIEVRGVVRGYHNHILKKLDITPEWPEFLGPDEKISDVPPIEANIGLYLVDDTIVEPNKTTIYAHPNNKQIISVKHGSGFYEIAMDSDEIAEVEYHESKRELIIIPAKSGELTIQLVDLCLVAQPVYVMVTVVTVKRIEVEITDKVELSRCAKGVIRLYDQFDRLINLTNLDYVVPIYAFSNNIATLQQLPRADLPLGEIHYTVTGIELGDTQLVFSLDSADDEVSSDPHNLQVFPPLKIMPRNATLLIGAKLQLTVQGGPQPDSVVEFNATVPDITEINALGILTGSKFGSTKVQAKAVGVHPSTGNRIIYSEDTVQVHVIPIVGIKIAAPLTRFKSGALVPVWITGIPEQISPMILGSVELPNIEYLWEVEEESVVSLNGIFNKVGIHYNLEDRISQRLMGLLPGKTSLNCTVTLPGKLAGKRKETIKYHARIDIEIVEALKLLKPKMTLGGRSLLMAPHSSIQIETNLDPTRTVSYSVGEHETQSLSTVTDSAVVDGGLVSVSPTGLIKAHGKLGRTMLLVIATDSKGMRQYLSYVVEVKPVHYMMMKIETQWRIHIDHSHRVLPLGSDFYLTAMFYDEIGSKFTAGPKDFNFRASRYDLIRLSQKSYNLDLTASVQVFTKKPGITVFKAWSENSADYVKIDVDQVVKPALNHLTSGDIICLWSPVVDDSMQFGLWNSSDEKLVMINENLHLAYIVATDHGFVKLTYSLQQWAPLELHVWPVSKVLLHYEHDILHPEHDLNPFVTNGPAGNVFTIALSLHGNQSRVNKDSNLLLGWHCKKELLQTVQRAPFQCHIHFSNESLEVDASAVFEVERKFIHQTGQYACQLVATDHMVREVSTAITNLTLWAISENEVESAPMQLTFIPNVYIEEEVYLKENSYDGTMDIIGLGYVLSQVEVEPADSSILYVDRGYLVEPTVKRYKIQVVDYHWRLADIEDAMGITVKSALTGQDVRVIVKVSGSLVDKCSPRSPFLDFLYTYYNAIMIIIALIIIFFITFFVYSRYMMPMVNVNISQYTPSNQTRSIRSYSGGSQTSPPPRGLCLSPANNLGRTPPSPTGGPLSLTTTPYRASTSYRSNSIRSATCTARNCTCANCPNRDPILSATRGPVCVNRLCTCAHCPNRPPGFGDASTLYASGYSPTSSPNFRRTNRFL